MSSEESPQWRQRPTSRPVRGQKRERPDKAPTAPQRLVSVQTIPEVKSPAKNTVAASLASVEESLPSQAEEAIEEKRERPDKMPTAPRRMLSVQTVPEIETATKSSISFSLASVEESLPSQNEEATEETPKNGNENSSAVPLQSSMRRVVSHDDLALDRRAGTLLEDKPPDPLAMTGEANDCQPRMPPRRFSTGSISPRTSQASASMAASAAQAARDFYEDDALSVVSGITNPTLFGNHIDVSRLDEEDEDDDFFNHRGWNKDGTQRDGDSLSEPSTQPLADEVVHSSLVRLARKFKQGVKAGTHTYHFKKYENCFVGSEAIDFMVKSRMVESRDDAIFLGQRFVHELNLFHHVHWDHMLLKDDYLFYKYTEDNEIHAGLSNDSILRTSSASTSDESSRRPSGQTNSTSTSSNSGMHHKDLKAAATVFQKAVVVDTHVYHFKKYKNCFVGSEAVDKMLECNLAATRVEAVFLGQRLLEEINLFYHVKLSFKDSYLFYRYANEEEQEMEDDEAEPMPNPTPVPSRKTSFGFSKKAVRRSSSMSGANGTKRSGFGLRRSISQANPRDQSPPPPPPIPKPKGPIKSILKRKLGDEPILPETSPVRPAMMQEGAAPHSNARLSAPQAPSRQVSITSNVIGMELATAMASLEKRFSAPTAPVRHGSIASASEMSHRTSRSRQRWSISQRETTISFGLVHTRVYDRGLEFNPATSSGPSVGLTWHFWEPPAEDLDMVMKRLEEYPPPDDNFILSRDEREEILEDWGYTRREISQAIRWNQRARDQRKSTLNRLTATSSSSRSK